MLTHAFNCHNYIIKCAYMTKFMTNIVTFRIILSLNNKLYAVRERVNAYEFIRDL